MLIFFTVISIGLIIFLIYFLFKALGFVINSTLLYRKMIDRQDAIIKILLDIRNNTKTLSDDQLRDIDEKTGY